jgi:hypothetical protein
MAFKILNYNIIDDTRNIVNAASVGVGTTTSSTAAALFVIGNTFATGISTASRFASNVAQGTAPISVASSTRVDTLNVQYLDGNDSSYYRNASNLNAGQVPGAQVTQSSGLTVTGNLSVSGNVTIGGTATQLNAQQLRISDRDITLGVTTDAFGNDVSTDTTANHGGIAIASTEGSPILNIPQQAGINTDPSTYKQMMWIKQGNYSGMGTDAWVFNYAVSIGNTASVQNLSRLTVGAGFTVFDTYLDATDIRARNITAVTNINASGIVTAVGGFNASSSSDYEINGTSVLNSSTLGSGVVNSSLTSVGTLTQLGVTGIVTAAGGFNASSSSDYEINGTSVLNSSTLGSGVVNSSLTSVGTLATLNATSITNTNINSSGINTAATYSVGITTVLSTVNSQIRLAGIATIDATTKATLERELAFAPNQFDDLSVTGIATFTNGPVLIGTATSTGTAGQALQVGSSGATRGAYISGSLGIGTTSPTQPLDVNGNARLRAGVYDFNNQVGAAGSVLISTGAGVSWTSITGAGGASITITDDPSTTTPKYLLFTSAISGSVTSQNVSSTKLSYIASSGSLGIGTTSPTDNLDVNGDVRLRARLKDFNNQVGAAGSVLISTGAGVSWTSISGAGGASIAISNAPGGSTPSYLLFTPATSGSVTTQNVSSNKLTYIDSTGSLGIGTTSPTQPLDVNGNARLRAGVYDFNNQVGAAGSVLISTGAGVSWTTISGAGGIAGVTITDDTSTPGLKYPLFTSATSGSVTGQFVDANGIVYNTATNCLGIGSLTPTSKLDIIGDIKVTGIVTAGDFNSTSDRKLKTNIQPITNPIEKVLQISGVSFNWKESGKPTLGVIAQEIELVLPELVSDTDPKTVNYNGLIGLLIECVKDQQKQIDELKGKL